MSLFNYDDLIYPFIVHVVKINVFNITMLFYDDEGDSLIIGDQILLSKLFACLRRDFSMNGQGVAIFFSPKDDYQPQKIKEED